LDAGARRYVPGSIPRKWFFFAGGGRRRRRKEKGGRRKEERGYVPGSTCQPMLKRRGEEWDGKGKEKRRREKEGEWRRGTAKKNPARLRRLVFREKEFRN
jgi:hypothetical protein